jgi:hypothetical protein
MMCGFVVLCMLKLSAGLVEKLSKHYNNSYKTCESMMQKNFLHFVVNQTVTVIEITIPI